MHVISDDFHVRKNITEMQKHAPSPRDRIEYAIWSRAVSR